MCGSWEGADHDGDQPRPRTARRRAGRSDGPISPERYWLNPYRIYRDEAADALRHQATAEKYTSFVAMPFRKSFSYRSPRIFQDIISAAVAEANGRGGLPRSFAPPQRVDRPQGAVELTEEIVLGILGCHIYIADLTRQNPGVVLETGIAFGTKSNRQIVLITQDDFAKLHFDLKINNIIQYRPRRSVTAIADAVYSAAEHYEEQVKRFLVDVRHRLSPDSHAVLLYFAQVQQQNVHFSLHPGNRGPSFPGLEGARRFDAAAAELRAKDMLWTDYKVGAAPLGDAFGMHATAFGWLIIESLWPHLARPKGAKTVPA